MNLHCKMTNHNLKMTDRSLKMITFHLNSLWHLTFHILYSKDIESEQVQAEQGGAGGPVQADRTV